MVMIKWDSQCNCDTCPGKSKPDPRSLKGEMVFGGWKCMCGCHYKSGKERENFIDMKKRMENEMVQKS